MQQLQTIVGTDVIQTLTNKILTGSTNNIMASSIKNSSTNAISISGTPSINQVLTATNAASASWQTLSTTTANGLASATSSCSNAYINSTNWTAIDSTTASWQSQNVSTITKINRFNFN